ncbi:hypothetical protein QYM36_017129 [Artemia franciscana]|uniref:PiggyBac transposable element-derived protein domain-containing protein n=1 Tax=Artemia franciscana TaxID=6661 RepID=A0AA88HG34_ARTSF|nr:hypothetical protein QYM36_017129 [Artemia franciscana]
MLMSIAKLPAMRMYWKRTIRYIPIPEAMSHDRFLTIQLFFHFNDQSLAVPSGQTGHDKLHKIRPIYDKLGKNIKIILSEDTQIVDEQMIPFKARLSSEQYLKEKPPSWGVSVYESMLSKHTLTLFTPYAPITGLSCGTIRSNRMKGAILERDTSLKKKGRGSHGYRLERFETQVSIVKLIDNKPVHVSSSYCAVAPVNQCQK